MDGRVKGMRPFRREEITGEAWWSEAVWQIWGEFQRGQSG